MIYDRKSWLHKWEQEVLHTFFLKLPEAHPCHVPDHVLFPIIIRFNFYPSGKTLNLYNYQKFFKHPPPSNCVWYWHLHWLDCCNGKVSIKGRCCTIEAPADHLLTTGNDHYSCTIMEKMSKVVKNFHFLKSTSPS